MSSIQWQDFLNVLTLKGSDTKVVNEVKSAPLNKKFNICYEANKSYLEEWIADKIKTEPKSPAESIQYRLKGNKIYQIGKDADALSIYNSSVMVAPHNTNEFALALANRSAVLMRLNHFKEAIRDIDLALQHGNNDIPRQKLYVRKDLLLQKLDPSKQSLQIVKELHPNDDKSIRKTTISEECLMVPSPKGGENTSFNCASAYVSLQCSAVKGRHVMATEDLDVGDIIFVEKPFALVVLPGQYREHCHHCCKEMVAFIPCQECRDAQFCSEECRMAAWDVYHRWECCGLTLCQSIGIAHLGLRVALMADDSDKYKQVHDLLTHIDDMKTEDIYQYTLTAVLLTLYLQKHTSFFQDRPDISVNAMGCRILRHIAQLICNGHAITKVETELPESGFTHTTSEVEVRIATAIYPSASMMNHSCEQNISNSFINQVLVVRAMKPIKKGEEVFNCYGPHHARMSRDERQKVLRDQYFFTCECSKCSDVLEYRQFSALRCSFCSGPVMEGASKCSECSRPQMLVELVNMALTAQEGYHQGQKYAKEGKIEDSVEILEKSVNLASKCLYKYNADLRTYKDSLARVYTELGRFREAREYVEECIVSVEKQFGSISMESARELIKLRDVIFQELSSLSRQEASDEYGNLLEKVEQILKKLKKIIKESPDDGGSCHLNSEVYNSTKFLEAIRDKNYIDLMATSQ